GDDRHVAGALGVGEIRHRRALLTAVPAPEHAVPALRRVAAPRVSRYRAPRPAKLLTAAAQRRVALVDGTLPGANAQPVTDALERAREALLDEEMTARFGCPLAP